MFPATGERALLGNEGYVHLAAAASRRAPSSLLPASTEVLWAWHRRRQSPWGKQPEPQQTLKSEAAAQVKKRESAKKLLEKQEEELSIEEIGAGGGSSPLSECWSNKGPEVWRDERNARS